jgi:hypothetical protein
LDEYLPKFQGFWFFRPMSPDAGGIMSVWQCTPSASPLSGSEGELVSVSISVDPRDLEGLLEALAHTGFPINPQIYHADGHSAQARTIVEFPAYDGGLPQVRAALAGSGLEAHIRVRGMLEELQALLGQEPDRGDSEPT